MGEASNSPLMYQGVLLGYEIIDSNNQKHAIEYIGQKDINKKNYFIAVNADGDINNPSFKFPVVTGIDDVLHMNTGQQKLYDASQLIDELNKLINHAILFTPDDQSYDNPDNKEVINELNAQAQFTHDFNHFSAYAGWEGSYTKAPNYPEFAKYINAKVNSDTDFANVPFLTNTYTH